MDERARNQGREEILRQSEQLSSTGMVGRELFKEFCDAHTYGTATPMQWLEDRLRVLRRRLEAGSEVSLYDRATGEVRPCASVAEFAAWVNQYVPDASIHDR
jgi:hypothetical protein